MIPRGPNVDMEHEHGAFKGIAAASGAESAEKSTDFRLAKTALDPMPQI
jgi:hypothetical protein